jgi:hypothetical protein
METYTLVTGGRERVLAKSESVAGLIEEIKDFSDKQLDNKWIKIIRKDGTSRYWPAMGWRLVKRGLR